MTVPPGTTDQPLGEGLRLVRYAPELRAAFLDFRRYHYGQASLLADPAYVEWLFGEGAPGAREKGAPLWLCEDRDQVVVGAQGLIRVALKVGQQTVPAAWSIDFAVREEVRKQGVGSALGAQSRKEVGTRLLLEGTPAAVRIALRVGWKAVCEVPLWVKPLDLGRFARRSEVDLAKRLAIGAAAPLLSILDRRALRAAVAAGVTLVPTAAFDERVDRIWQACAAELPVACPRDLAFLSWRFGQYPAEGRYRIHWLQRGGETLGYAVLRLGDHQGARTGFVVDFLCPRALLPALLARAVELFRAEGATIARCLHLGPHAARAFLPLGFFKRSSGWPFMVRTTDAAAEVAALMEDPAQWFLTAADSNVDRPRDGV